MGRGRGRGRGYYASSQSSYNSHSKTNNGPYSRAPRTVPDPVDAQHKIEYAKAGTGKCHGPPPCKDSLISSGALRYGSKAFIPQYGAIWSWRHWGCVTPNILQQLKATGISKIAGYSILLPEDKRRVQNAISVGHVAPEDVPASAKPLDWSQIHAANAIKTDIKHKCAEDLAPEPSNSSQPTPSSSGQKRKADVLYLSQSTPSSSQTLTSPQPAASQTTVVIEDSDDEFDIAPITEVPKDDHYLDYRAAIVGVQYYKGLVNRGEEVNVVRQPENKYDSNAIAIVNMGNQMVGHLKREIAARLSPLINSNLIAVEGIMDDGNMNGGSLVYTLPITLKIYGQPGLRSQLEPLLIWATPKQRGFTDAMRAASMPTPVPSSSSGPSGRSAEQVEAKKAQELREVINSFESVNDESRRASLLDSLCSTNDILNLPVQDDPPPPSIENGELTTNLMRHQLQALKWMLEKENPVLPTAPDQPPVQFWKYCRRDKAYYENIVSHQPLPFTSPPALGRGGLMADAMGLGKTLSMISLIVATLKDKPVGYTNSTLIVAPVSVLRTWEAQVSEHCAHGLLKVFTYYDKSREIVTGQLQKYDIVITSYTTVAGEFAAQYGQTNASQKRKRGHNALFGVKWKRIVLDEGHTIRNPTTKVHKATVQLQAERRWVVTGTPILNSPKDLGAVLAFLKICSPFDNLAYYSRALIRPIARSDPNAYVLLKALMSHICLRRTKEMQDSSGKYLVELPPVEMTTIRVPLDPKVRQLYDEVHRLSQEQFLRQVGTNPSGIQMPPNALSLLTRMRQLTLHPSLIPLNYLDELRSSLSNGSDSPSVPIQVTPQDRIQLQHRLFQLTEDCEECPVCFDTLQNAVITPCVHAFCRDCILTVIQRDSKCPMDRRDILTHDLIEPLEPVDATQAQFRVDDSEDGGDETEICNGSSAKIDQLIRLVQLTPSYEKSVVFSQFTSFLDKIAEQLSIQGIPFVRFDGSMSAARRREVLERFNIPLSGSPSSLVPKPSGPKRHRQSVGVTNKVAEDEFLASLEERYKNVIPDPPAKRPRPSFMPELSSDSDSDLTTPVNPARSTKKPNIIASSDDFEDKDVKSDPGSSEDDSMYEDEESAPSSPEKPVKGKGKNRANGKQKRAALLKSYDVGSNIPKVLLISLKAGALGVQLIAANNVFLMDPWWQEGIESQAIDRCNRIGQKRDVHVYQMIAEDTIESRVLEIQDRKRALIKQAFSGTKAKETQRTRKEARLQDMIELFGIRGQATSSTNSLNQPSQEDSTNSASANTMSVGSSDVSPQNLTLTQRLDLDIARCRR